MKTLLAGLGFALLFQVPFPQALATVRRYANHPGPYADVVLDAAGADAYFAGPGAPLLPPGVSHLTLASHPGAVQGAADIDFDQLGSARPGNPLLLLFAGKHHLEVEAQVDSAAAPKARLTVTSVELDGEVIPNLLIDAALRAFVQPRHPDIGRSFSIPLPKHATGAVVGEDQVTLQYPR